MNIRILFVLMITIKRISLQQIRYSVQDSTSQGKTISGKYSNLAIDGDIDSCAISESKENELPWWSVKLDKDYNVERIIIDYNNGLDHYKYMNHLKIFVSKNAANLEENVCVSYKGKKDKAPRFIILNCDKPVTGNVVTIKRFGGLFRNWLVLCEVQILADLEIISFNKLTSHNGIFFENTSGLAVDGNNVTCAKIIAKKGEFAWWRVFLGEDHYIDKVVIYFNPKSPDFYTINYFIIYVSNEDLNFQKYVCDGFNTTTQQTKFSGVIELKCREPKPRGRYVTIKKIGGTTPQQLQGLCEIKVYSQEFSKFNQMSRKECIIYKCIPLGTCLPASQMCDGINDCPDGTDELPCTCKPEQYHCRFYGCITKEWLCDGFKDCPLGDDETVCDCPQDMFKCAKRQKCISKEKHCDGVVDCPDHSDENCFSFKHRFVVARYKGKPEVHICSTYWDNINSRQMCNYLLKSITFVDQTFAMPLTYDIEQFKLITLKKHGEFENNTPSINYFRESSTCESERVVRIECRGVVANDKSMCGVRAYPDADLETYIINGKMAKAGAWPWHVQIFHHGNYLCGGSLIRRNWVLTAAHCTENLSPGELTVKVGTHLFNDPKVPRHRISHIVNHPLYKDKANDIALIRIAKPVNFTKDIKLICLPRSLSDSEVLKSFNYCIQSSVGEIDREFTKAPRLMQGRMNLMTDDECAQNVAEFAHKTLEYYKNYITERHMICAGSAPTPLGVASCLSDGGSPLMCKDRQGLWTVIGVMSHEFPVNDFANCTNSVFTKVYHYIDLINEAFRRDDAETTTSSSGIVSFIIITYLIFM